MLCVLLKVVRLCCVKERQPLCKNIQGKTHNTKTLSHIEINVELLPHLLTIQEEHHWRRRNRQSQESENRDPPSIPKLLENRRREQRRDTAQYASECRPGRDRGSGVLLEAVDVVVLNAVQNHDLADAVKVRRGDRGEPVSMQLHRPGEPEERDWDEYRADVGQGEAVLGLRFAVVALC